MESPGIPARFTRLPDEANVNQKLGVVIGKCVVLHKAAQIFARDSALPLELRTILQQFEVSPVHCVNEEIENYIAFELGEIAAKLHLHVQSVTAGSIAVIVPFNYRNSLPAPNPEGVLKFLKPNIEKRIQEEVSVLQRLPEWVAATLNVRGSQTRVISKLLEDAGYKLEQELNLENERKNLETAARFYADSSNIRIPNPLPIHGERFFAMEFVEAQSLSNIPARSNGGGQRLRRNALSELILRPFLTGTDDIFIHGDLHGGNVCISPAGKLVVYDWSVVGQLSHESRRAIILIVVGVLSDREDVTSCGLGLLARGTLSAAAITREAGDAMKQRKFFSMLDLSWIIGFAVRLSSDESGLAKDLAIAQKSILAMNNVLGDVAKDSTTWGLVVETAIQQLIRELPYRYTRGLNDVRYGIPLSNYELLSLQLMLPATALRGWINQHLRMSSA